MRGTVQRPSYGNNVLEARLGDPRVFKMIGDRFGNSRGNLNFEWDVVRGGAGEGGEDRVRSNVNESMVNAFKGGRRPQVYQVN